MINWLVALSSGIVMALLLLTLGRAGGQRWWRRRRPLVQLLLLLLLPMLVIGIVLGAALMFHLQAHYVAGLLFGAGLGTLLPLLATSYLIEQIRRAFGPQAPDDEL